MSKYYSMEEVSDLLQKHTKLQNVLFCKGFLIVSERIEMDFNSYPFYGNFQEESLQDGFFLYYHKEAKKSILHHNNITFFLIGHAFDPFSLIYDEEEILNNLAQSYAVDESHFWDLINNLTGVFCLGFVKDSKITHITDCTGMQMVYYGVVKEKYYISSHSRLIADINNLKQDKYITKLTNSKYFRYWGTWLPGDLSPFKELKRTVPNFYYSYGAKNLSFTRFYPNDAILHVVEKADYHEIIRELATIISNSLEVIAKKYKPNVSIAVTGGRDSATTLAAAKNCYADFSYFSYISNESEEVDALAAKEICNKMQLNHTI